jgi:hypothetical protein
MPFVDCRRESLITGPRSLTRHLRSWDRGSFMPDQIMPALLSTS